MAALDTSVVLPALLAWHPDHIAMRRAAADARIPAHALLESYAVMTRLPAPHRLTVDVARELLTAWFPAERILDHTSGTGELVERCAASGVAGGAAYDALIGLTAAAYGEVLLTRDARSAATLDRLGVTYRLLG